MGRIRKREEDPADIWLRAHDPYYRDMSRGKMGKIEKPYLTPDQEVARARREIPLSSLNDMDIDILRLSKG